MFDKVETLSDSLIQHGPYNNRIYLMKVGDNENIDQLVEKIFDLSIVNEYTKIFVSVPAENNEPFLEKDFKLEATIPGLYNGQEDGNFLSLYLNAKRGYLPEADKQKIAQVLDTALESAGERLPEMPAEFKLIELDEEYVGELSDLYKSVFQFDPFPIYKKSYLKETMREGVKYFGVLSEGRLVAASSATIDRVAQNAEMTDFATNKDFRGMNLSYYLLEKMLHVMKEIDLKVVYTIARSNSYGMNKTFARLGFKFSGTLIKNTRIGDSIESMNVWYKHL